jgi:phosphoenolpyruvate synthase/pyruvate phosphate dikinase
MAALPSNVLEAGTFAERFDEFSIGSEDPARMLL